MFSFPPTRAILCEHEVSGLFASCIPPDCFCAGWSALFARRRAGLGRRLLLLLGGPPVFGASPEGLSQQARGQIRTLLEEKAARTPARRKMDSHLIHAAKRHRGEPFVAAVPDLELDLKLEPDGRVLVDITGTASPQLLALVAQGGSARSSAAFPQFHAVRALAALGQLESLAASNDVTSLRRAVPARLNAARLDSQGDLTHAAAHRSRPLRRHQRRHQSGCPLRQRGHLANSQVAGAVTVLPGQSGSPETGEGTASSKSSVDLAPGLRSISRGDGPAEPSSHGNILNLRQERLRRASSTTSTITTNPPFKTGSLPRRSTPSPTTAPSASRPPATRAIWIPAPRARGKGTSSMGAP